MRDERREISKECLVRVRAFRSPQMKQNGKRRKKDSGLNSSVLRSRSTFRNTESRVEDTKQHIEVGFEIIFGF